MAFFLLICEAIPNHRPRRHRHHWHGMPFSRRAEQCGGFLEISARGRRCGGGNPVRPLEHRALLRRRAGHPRQVDRQARRFHRRDRSIRSAIFRHLAARSSLHRSAAAPAARDGVGGFGRCRCCAQRRRRHGHRGFRRNFPHRLPADPGRHGRPFAYLAAFSHRTRAQHRGQSHFLLSQPHGPEHRHGHGVFVRAHRGPCRGRSPACGTLRHSSGWRGDRYDRSR